MHGVFVLAAGRQHCTLNRLLVMTTSSCVNLHHQHHLTTTVTAAILTSIKWQIL